MFKGLGNMANLGSLMKQAQEMGGKMQAMGRFSQCIGASAARADCLVVPMNARLKPSSHNPPSGGVVIYS